MLQDIALYLHVPFCRRKCHYCSFVSYERREAAIPEYIKALEKEMAYRSNGERVHSIYLGGGTPSLLPSKHIGELFSTIRSLFTVDEDAEITMEANPGTIDRAYLEDVRDLGINRLSLGIQSLDDRELKVLGRIHTAAEAKEAVHCARAAGFDNLSLDLIYGLPGQTLASWRNTLDEALDMKPEHLSLYCLTLEDDTPMQRVIDEKRLPAIEPDQAADQYELAEDMLEEQGYGHYEISNWAKKGRECRHNLIYWHNLPYMGVGVAAHSYVNWHRSANTESIDTYLKAMSAGAAPSPVMDEEISRELMLAETVILGLRLHEGISADEIRNRLDPDIDILKYYRQQVKEMTSIGLLEVAEGCIRLTRRGRLLGNEVFWRFLPE